MKRVLLLFLLFSLCGTMLNAYAGGSDTSGYVFKDSNEADGSYSFDLVTEDSGYMTTASVLGYNSITSTSFDVTENQNIVPDIPIVILPTVTVTGQVVTTDTNTGIQAIVSLTGYETYEVDTDANGNFTIANVFTGHTYAGIVIVAGYQPGSFDVVVGTTDLNIGAVFVTEILYPATDIIAEISGDAVAVTWGEPGGAGAGTWLTKGAEENNDGIGTGGAAVIRVAHRYTQDELVDYQGMFINAIKMFPREADATYTLNVWAGDDGMTELYSQDIDEFIVESWNEYQLDTFVAIPNVGDIYIGYTTDTPSGYPCGADAGPYVAGGDMIMLGTADSWGLLHILAPSLDVNWNLQAYLSYGRGRDVITEGYQMIRRSNGQSTAQPLIAGNLEPIPYTPVTLTRALEGYKVWRLLAVDQDNENNWDLLTPAMITDLAYTDTDWQNLDSGVYKFAVKAFYTNDNEAPVAFSNELLNNMYGSVEGSVTDADSGAPISNATITLDGNTTNTDVSGSFTFTDVLAGEYTINATAGAYTSDSQIITVTATGITTVTFSLTPSSYLFEDGFENYADFSLEFGSWTNIDVDLTPSYAINGTIFEHSGDAFAYIVFNPLSTTPPLDELFDAHTGTKYLAAFASIPNEGSTNNDWLISQQFTLGATGNLSFWAKSVTDMYGLEIFNVLVSDGSTNPDDFTPITGGNNQEASTEWTEFSYNLSDFATQTIRFAIQSVSEDAFMFLIDDIALSAPNGTPNNGTDAVMTTILGGNYPNPFNPETTISYNMKNSGNVTIEVYNILGQKVKTLVNENKTAGNHTVVWAGLNDNNDSVASGIYFYKMRSGKYSKTHKMILMK
ncbi:MAG: hypothetical protein B6226_04920 [Candidatus Cloacimonetes bacterium 4572_65]|nr:MAG: hypothetical protein B6226_04920 [Candidatus Cloacimonetes bacterium 4572_65]